MDTKKFLASLAVCLAAHACAFAYGSLWYDWNTEFKPLKKIVLYPFANTEAPDLFLDSDEGTSAFADNTRLWERLSKKLSGHNFLRLSKGIFEEQRVLQGNYAALLAPYESEASRAKAVADATMADAYLVPRFRENWVRIDHSPEMHFDVRLKSWMEETGGPRGSRTYDERSWTEHHILPAKDLPFRIMDIEYELLGTGGEKIVTYENSRRRYYANEKDMFQDLTDEFVDDLKRVKRGKFKPKEKNETIRVGFGEISVPPLEGDEPRTRAVQFAMRDEARRLDDVRLEYGSAGNAAPQYRVSGTIDRYELRPEWHDPYITVSTNCVSTREKKWRDREGKEHTMTIRSYSQSIVDHFGYYTYDAIVSARLHLIDTRTGEAVVSYQGENYDDKEIDACRHIMREFYKKANKFLKHTKKDASDQATESL